MRIVSAGCNLESCMPAGRTERRADGCVEFLKLVEELFCPVATWILLIFCGPRFAEVICKLRVSRQMHHKYSRNALDPVMLTTGLSHNMGLASVDPDTRCV